MKAIIIQDADAANLLDLLKLQKFSDAPVHFEGDNGHLQSLSSAEQLRLLDALHRRFHYVVCRWLQEQGATVTR